MSSVKGLWRIWLAFNKAKSDKKLSLREMIALIELACKELGIDMDKTGVTIRD